MILVAGASGTIGREVVRGLQENGLACRALVRDGARHSDMESALCEVVTGDFLELETLPQALDSCERALLLTPLSEHMGEMQSNFIGACQLAGVRHVVKISSMGAGVRSPLQIGKWHGLAEAELESSGLAWTHIRPAYFMQNTLPWKTEMHREHTMPWPLGNAKVSWIDTRDIADVAVRALQNDDFLDQCLNLSGSEALGASEVAHVFSRVLDVDVSARQLSLDQYRASLLQSGVTPALADALKQLHGVLSQGHGAAISGDVEKVLGRAPRTFAQFAADFAPHFNRSIASQPQQFASTRQSE